MSGCHFLKAQDDGGTTPAIAADATAAMPPVATANPSPPPPAAAAAGAVVPVPVVDLLHFRLSVFVKALALWRFEFIENAGSRAWNTRHCVDWAHSAGKRGCSGNAKHRSQE